MSGELGEQVLVVVGDRAALLGLERQGAILFEGGELCGECANAIQPRLRCVAVHGADCTARQVRLKPDIPEDPTRVRLPKLPPGLDYRRRPVFR